LDGIPLHDSLSRAVAASQQAGGRYLVVDATCYALAGRDVVEMPKRSAPAVMNEWTGQLPESASMAAIGQRLCELGLGSSAVVAFDRHDAPGHWFNAVNYEGTILAVDGQAALFEEWPPSKDGLGFDESYMSYSDAIYFTADGKVARNDHE
jgi:hypothetical protein